LRKIKNKLPPVVGVVLAGGISRRFGQPKAGVIFNGKTFLEIAVERLSEVCEKVVVSVDKNGRFKIPDSATEILDFDPGGGAAVGILSVLRSFAGHAVIVNPVDMPLLPVETLIKLLNSRGKHYAVLLEIDGILQPLVGIYEPQSAIYFEECLNIGKRKLIDILKPMPVKKVSVSTNYSGKNFFANINTQSDMKLINSIK